MNTLFIILIVLTLITLVEVRILGVVALILLMLLHGILYSVNKLTKWIINKLVPSYNTNSIESGFKYLMDHIYNNYCLLQSKFKE